AQGSRKAARTQSTGAAGAVADGRSRHADRWTVRHGGRHQRGEGPMSGVHICSFDALPDVTRKQQRDQVYVLGALAQAGRFSVFEATANQTIARTMTFIMQSGWVRDIGGEYPWMKVEITDAGRAVLEGNAP